MTELGFYFCLFFLIGISLYAIKKGSDSLSGRIKENQSKELTISMILVIITALGLGACIEASEMEFSLLRFLVISITYYLVQIITVVKVARAKNEENEEDEEDDRNF